MADRITGGSNAGIPMGIGPLEYMSLMEQMSGQGVGSGRIHSSTRLAAAFSKANGVDTSATSNLYGSMYTSTGDASVGSSVLAMAVKSGIEKTRLSEYLSLVSRNTGISAQAMHGAGATPGQAGAAAALAGMALNSGNHYMKSAEFFNVAQNGLRGAGSVSGDISIAKALGMFSGDMSWEKIFEMEQMKEGGFLKSPKAFASIMGDLTSKSREGRAAELMKKFPSYNLSTKSALGLIDVYEGDIFTKAKNNGIQSLTKEQEDQLSATLTSKYGSLAGSGAEIKDARKTEAELASGKSLNEAFGKLEESIYETITAINQFGGPLGLLAASAGAALLPGAALTAGGALLGKRVLTGGAGAVVTAVGGGAVSSIAGRIALGGIGGIFTDLLFPHQAGSSNEDDIMKNMNNTAKTSSRAYRNNNPGNLRFSSDKAAIASGATGRDKDGFAIYPTVSAGDKAREDLIFGKFKDLKLTDMISKYAPPGENNTSRYKSIALKSVGNKNLKMSEYNSTDRANLLSAMKLHEGFYSKSPGELRVADKMQKAGEAGEAAGAFVNNLIALLIQPIVEELRKITSNTTPTETVIKPLPTRG